MTDRNAYPTPPGNNPFERLAQITADEARATGGSVTQELPEYLGAPLICLDGYQTTCIYTDEELEAFEKENWLMAGVDSDRYGPGAYPELPRLHIGENNTLWRVTDTHAHYANHRQQELHDEVAALTETASGVKWIPASSEGAEKLIAARAPEGTDGYWIVGEPVNICQRFEVAAIKSNKDHPMYHEYGRLDYWQREAIEETGYWDVTKYVLQPVQYFSTEAVTYRDSHEGEIARSVNRVLADPYYRNLYLEHEARNEEALDKELIKVILQAEALGVDGLQYIEHITSQKRQARTIVEIGISRDDADIIKRGVAVGEAIPLEDQKRNQHLRGLVKLIAKFDIDLATSAVSGISRSSVQALALIDVGKLAEAEKAQTIFQQAKQVALANTDSNRSTTLGKMFEATLQLDEEFARGLLPEMSEAARSQCEQLLEAAQVAAGTPVGTEEVVAIPGKERELTIAESLLEEYRQTGNHDALVKALAAGGLVKDTRRRQQLFNEIADRLTDVSLPSNNE